MCSDEHGGRKLSGAAAVAETKDHDGWIAFAETAAMLDGKPDPAARLIQPEEGLMVLFPSYFYHSTVPFETDETRISVAFDLMPA